MMHGMKILVAGAHGRLGSRVTALLLHRGHAVRALVTRQSQADALTATGAEAVVADLRGDVEWTADGCDGAIFAAGARHRPELAAIDAGGAAKFAEAADRYDAERLILCSVVGASQAHRRQGGVREFLEAKHAAERRVARLDVPWTILRFGRLPEAPGAGRIATELREDGRPLTLSRDDAAIAVVDALERRHLARLVVNVLDGDQPVASALDAVTPRELPTTAGAGSPLGRAQSDNPPDAPDMIEPDAHALDADVEWEGDGPLPPRVAGNDDPAPRIP
jgi:nucleoside-diphosphate-sugar epimerase